MRSRFERSGINVASVGMIAFLAATAFVLPFVPSARAANVNVSIVDYAFDPSTVNVQIGDTVIWTNNGAVDHTVTSTPSGPLNSGQIVPGGNYQYTFTVAGTYDYICSDHPTLMTGSVVVGGVIPEFSGVTFVAIGLMAVILGMIVAGKKR